MQHNSAALLTSLRVSLAPRLFIPSGLRNDSSGTSRSGVGGESPVPGNAPLLLLLHHVELGLCLLQLLLLLLDLLQELLALLQQTFLEERERSQGTAGQRSVQVNSCKVLTRHGELFPF